MRFEANSRLLELLVGSNLYPDEDVCVRELLQNSHDALLVRRTSGGGIRVRHSAQGRWFEVEDDGCGMSLDVIGDSFLEIGADKESVLGKRTPDQIGYFGVGVLSMFLVAASIKVHTMAEGHPGLRFSVNTLDDDIEVTEEVRPGGIGTTIRVDLRPAVTFNVSQIPVMVAKYARHIEDIEVTDEDTGITIQHQDTWHTEDLVDVQSWIHPEVREARLGFQRALFQSGSTIGNRIRLTNGGFLVEDAALDLARVPPLGYSGEIDLHPDNLQIVLSRERYQRDEHWANLGRQLAVQFEEQAWTALNTGQLLSEGADPNQQRQLLCAWFHLVPTDPEFTRLRDLLSQQIFGHVRFSFAEGSARSLEEVTAKLPAPRLYYRTTNAPGQLDRQLDDEGVPVQYKVEVTDSLRIGALHAAGFPVLQSNSLSFTLERAGSAEGITLDEVSHVVEPLLAARGITCLPLSNADPADLDLSQLEAAPAIRELLTLSTVPLRLAAIAGSTRRSVIDSSGVRYLNLNNPTTRRIIRQLAAAHGNSLRQGLLDAVLVLEEFHISDAREGLLKLLEAPDLPELATTQTTPFTSSALEERVRRLLEEYEDRND